MTFPLVRRVNVASTTWLVVSGTYRSERAARRAFDRIERKTRRLRGDESARDDGGVGIYRHGPPNALGTCITVVALEQARAKIERVARLLDDAEDVQLHPQHAMQMIVRRARVVVEAGNVTGRSLSRRPLGRGATLTDDGQLIEQEPPQG